jgi:predicted RND superfamily exporter protein
VNRLDIFGIAFCLVAGALFLLGISKLQSNTEDVLQWLPDQSEARQKYDLFETKFGGDDFLIVTWDECTIDDPRLDSVTQTIRDSDTENLIQSVSNGKEIIERLSSEVDLSAKNIQSRFRGVFFGLEDPATTSLFIELSRKGTANRRGALDLVWAAIDSQPDLKRSEIGIGGYPYIATFIDEQLNKSYRWFLIPSVIMATLVALFCLRDFGLTVIVFTCAMGASGLSVALIPLCGVKYGGLMSIIPALVFVLAISGSIHLIRYGLDAIGDPRKLLSIGWKPCTISATTTAIGMLSLVRSDFPAIRNFGIFCASGVGIALLYQLFLVPWLLDRFGKTGLNKLAARTSESTFWVRMVEWIRGRKVVVSIASLMLMGLGAWGLTRLTAEVEVEKLFKPNSEVILSLKGLERRLGPMDQTELLIMFDNVDAEQFPDRAKLIRRIQFAVKKIPDIDVAYSLVNALPNEPRKTNVRSMMRRSAYRTVLRREREKMANNSLLSLSDNTESWRMSIRFPFTKPIDFIGLRDRVEQVAQKVVDDFKFEDPNHVRPELVYTGKTHLFQHAQTTLLKDLFQNFLLAFLIITPILIIVLRSVALGLIAMIPNVFPTLMVFGGLGWSQYPVDLAIAMTACVALGIAVDDTTHFLIRFRDFGGKLHNILEPVKHTISQCGPAMLHTTLIGGAGLFAYYFSDMLVVSRFSWAITMLLGVALLADVIMLPAILFLLGSDGESEAGISDERVVESDAGSSSEFLEPVRR